MQRHRFIPRVDRVPENAEDETPRRFIAGMVAAMGERGDLAKHALKSPPRADNISTSAAAAAASAAAAAAAAKVAEVTQSVDDELRVSVAGCQTCAVRRSEFAEMGCPPFLRSRVL